MHRGFPRVVVAFQTENGVVDGGVVADFNLAVFHTCIGNMYTVELFDRIALVIFESRSSVLSGHRAKEARLLEPISNEHGQLSLPYLEAVVAL